VKHKVSELEGALLDAAVAMAEGERPQLYGVRECLLEPKEEFGALRHYRVSSDWQTAGPIIERERISIRVYPDGEVSADVAAEFAGGEIIGSLARGDGPTPLLAAMRAYVASKFGEEVELP
jgi:hypothetical protein